MGNALQWFTTEELLRELNRRGIWYYTWTDETFKFDLGDFYDMGVTDDECERLCEAMYYELDTTFAETAQDLLIGIRNNQ